MTIPALTILNKFPSCDPINKIYESLTQNGFKLVEQRVEDYHFHQLYFKLRGSIHLTKGLNFSSFKKIENKYICGCHWSTIELVET